MVMHEATKKGAWILGCVGQLLFIIAATVAGLALGYLAVHLVYGSTLLLARHALLFVLSYGILMVLVALRASKPFWREMAKINWWILGYASFFFIVKLLSVRLLRDSSVFGVRDLLAILVCGGILSAAILCAKRGRGK